MQCFDRRLAALAAALTLAGCASPPPAPVESRTRPPVVAARPAHTLPPPQPAAQVAAAPATGASVAPPPPPEVQAAPVRSSGLQVRPLGPVEERAAGVPLRSGPSGTRQPWSEDALAQVRRSGGAAPVAAASQPSGAAASPTPAAPAAPAAPATTAPPPAATSAAGFAWPARGRVLHGFSAPNSMGIAIAGAVGDPVSAAADGRVIFSGPGPRGYGNLVIVKHDGDTVSVYGHNSVLLVKEGQQVTRGQKLAELGASGTDSPKLHFEIRKAGKPVDPQKLLPAR